MVIRIIFSTICFMSGQIFKIPTQNNAMLLRRTRKQTHKKTTRKINYILNVLDEKSFLKNM